jgi:hypothetical protein
MNIEGALAATGAVSSGPHGGRLAENRVALARISPCRSDKRRVAAPNHKVCVSSSRPFEGTSRSVSTRLSPGGDQEFAMRRSMCVRGRSRGVVAALAAVLVAGCVPAEPDPGPSALAPEDAAARPTDLAVAQSDFALDAAPSEAPSAAPDAVPTEVPPSAGDAGHDAAAVTPDAATPDAAAPLSRLLKKQPARARTARRNHRGFGKAE